MNLSVRQSLPVVTVVVCDNNNNNNNNQVSFRWIEEMERSSVNGIPLFGIKFASSSSEEEDFAILGVNFTNILQNILQSAFCAKVFFCSFSLLRVCIFCWKEISTKAYIKKLMKIDYECHFHQHFTSSIFAMRRFFCSFHLLKVCNGDFFRFKEISTIAAHKKLVKLTI